MNSFLKVGAVAVLTAVTCVSVLAGDFSVTPVRIFMEARDRAIAITVVNEGDEEIVMQADLYSWHQKPGGDDDLVLTEDMILSPPILKLAPKSRQIVRLARLGPAPASDQLTYRMIVREVPEAKPASKELKLQIALAFSLPVFITPPGAKRQLSCSVERVAADTVNAVCENTGKAYAQPVAFALVAENETQLALRDTGGYILPTIKRGFAMKSPGAPIPAGKGKLRVTLDDGTVQSFEAALL